MTEAKKTTLLVSPKGEMLFSNLKTPRTNKHSGNTEYSVRMYFDGDTKGVEEFKKSLKKINKALIVTEDQEGNIIVKKDGDFIVNARAKDRPTVLDTDGSELEAQDVPMIESGTATLVLSSFEGKSGKGGGINLQGVQLLDIVEYEGGDSVDPDAIKEALKNAHNN